MTLPQRKLLLGLTCLAQLLVCAYLIYRWEAVLHSGQAYKFITQPVDPYDAFRGRYVALQLEQNQVAISRSGPESALTAGQTVYADLDVGTNGYAILTAIHAERPKASNAYIKAKVNYVESEPRLQPGDIIDPLALATRIWTATDAVSTALRERVQEYERTIIEPAVLAGTNSLGLAGTLASLIERQRYDQDFNFQPYDKEKPTKFGPPRIVVWQLVFEAYADLLKPLPAARVHLNLPFDRYYMEETQAPGAEQAYWEHSRSGEAERTYIIVRVRHGLGVIEKLMIGEQAIETFLRSSPPAP